MAPATDTAPPTTTRHTGRLGVSAELVEVRGGLDGLLDDALRHLAGGAPCGGAGDGSGAVTLSTSTDDRGFVTASAELLCADPRCLTAAAAAERAAKVSTAAPGADRLRALVELITPHTAQATDTGPTEVTHDYETGLRAELAASRPEFSEEALVMEAREELAGEHPWRRDDPEPPVTVTDNGRGRGRSYLTIHAQLRCADPRCLVLVPATETFNDLAAVIDHARQYRGELPPAARDYLDQAYRLLLPPLWPTEDGPLPAQQTPEAAELRTTWLTRERSIRAELRALAEAIEAHAAPTT
ncbi:hypothetical protein [Kitasatospora sp. NPDC059327]|uniref:hypothetical protein n=1 Tax=Kitasatospora sp. NPDC059327 TaxID=3346803 RepID=UPI00369F45C6